MVDLPNRRHKKAGLHPGFFTSSSGAIMSIIQISINTTHLLAPNPFRFNTSTVQEAV